MSLSYVGFRCVYDHALVVDSVPAAITFYLGRVDVITVDVATFYLVFVYLWWAIHVRQVATGLKLHMVADLEPRMTSRR